jgi:succinate dehydrogenase/fumarate reductase cytochrome b subunit (b558 family)
MERTQGRRLHTIAGAIVLGAFLLVHLATNASVLSGAASYARAIGGIQRWPFTGVLEILFVLLPLAFHAVFGLRLLRRGASDAEIERYGDRRLWMAQRGSATVVFLFVLAHFFETRAQRLFFGAGPEATYTILSAHLSWTWAGVPWVALGYIVGIAATCFHLANGLFAASALKGWATARMRTLTWLVSAALFALGFLTVLAFATGTRLIQPTESEVPCGSAVPISSSRP